MVTQIQHVRTHKMCPRALKSRYQIFVTPIDNFTPWRCHWKALETAMGFVVNSTAVKAPIQHKQLAPIQQESAHAAHPFLSMRQFKMQVHRHLTTFMNEGCTCGRKRVLNHLRHHVWKAENITKLLTPLSDLHH
jgi:hypothetical protein